jgi:hypothetical protein
VVDVVGLYMRCPANAVVLSVNEKTRIHAIHALGRTQLLLQLRPGQIERRTHDYKRHGTTSLCAAFDIATGRVIGRVTKRASGKEFTTALRTIEQSVLEDLPPGSTRLRVGSRSSSVAAFVAEALPASLLCETNSVASLAHTIATAQNPLFGRRALSQSSQRSFELKRSNSIRVNRAAR